MNKPEIDEIEKLKEHIVSKHQYHIDDNDPILMFVTINRFMLEDYKKIFNKYITDFEELYHNINQEINKEINNSIKNKEIELLNKIGDINKEIVYRTQKDIKDYFEQEYENKKEIIKSNNKLELYFFITIFINIIILTLMFLNK